MIMYEEELNQIQAVVDKLVRDANARVVCIVDKNGQLIAASGETENLDTTSLASLIAGTIAAMGGMAKLLKENEFPTQFHEGVKANIHIQLVGNRVILSVIFDSRATLGLVRLRVKRASDELNAIFEALTRRAPARGAGAAARPGAGLGRPAFAGDLPRAPAAADRAGAAWPSRLRVGRAGAVASTAVPC
jgi:predicted regulator of Ras-like GTPase activity (Roadblock/LC7/MglB family)